MFLGKDPCDLSYDWKEWHLQAYVVQMARREGYVVHGDQNGASKTPKGWSQAAATGMLKGWPDLCFILPSRGCVFVELKLGDGRASKEQEAIHGALKAEKVEIYVVSADCPAECWEKVLAIVSERG